MRDHELANDADAPLSPVMELEDLFRDEYAALVRLGLAITGNLSAAEEAAQECFVSACRHWPRLREHPKPALWLRRTLINHCYSRWRRLRTESRALLKFATAQPCTPAVDDNFDALWQAVKALPRRQSQVIALTYLDGLSLAQIAEVLGCSAETVSTHLRRARAVLAQRLIPRTTDDGT